MMAGLRERLTTRRDYHSPTRRQQAEATRRRILDAASVLFRERGYAGTTLEAIATSADVSPKTVAAHGSKRSLLAELVDPLASGGRQQEVIDELRATSEPRRRLELVAHLTRRVYEGLLPEFELVRGAQAVAPELAEVARQVGERPRAHQARLMTLFCDQGALRAGVSPEEATDVLWTLTGFDLFRALVIDCGWPAQRYEVHLTDLLIERLLAPSVARA